MNCSNLLMNSGVLEWVGDLPLGFLIENCLIYVYYFENRTGEITAEAYLVSITEIISGFQQLATGALFIVNNCVLGVVMRKPVLLFVWFTQQRWK